VPAEKNRRSGGTGGLMIDDCRLMIGFSINNQQ
jgi:hypothetical protein